MDKLVCNIESENRRAMRALLQEQLACVDAITNKVRVGTAERGEEGAWWSFGVLSSGHVVAKVEAATPAEYRAALAALLLLVGLPTAQRSKAA